MFVNELGDVNAAALDCAARSAWELAATLTALREEAGSMEEFLAATGGPLTELVHAR